MNSDVADVPQSGRPGRTAAAILFDRAREQMQVRDYEALLQTGQQIIDAHPQKVSGFIVLTQGLLHLNRQAEALRAVQRGLEVHPRDPKLEAMMFRMLLVSEEAEAAAAFVARLSAEGRVLPVAAQSDLATFQMRTRDFDGARRTGEWLVSSHPERASSFCLLAQALICLNQPKLAAEVLARGTAIHPGDRKVLKLIYHTHVMLGDTEAALCAARALIDVQPSDERAQYWVYLSLMSLTRFDEAEEHLSIARDQAPAFDYGKHSSHFCRAKDLARNCPAIAAAWEVGLSNRPESRRAWLRAESKIPTLHYWSQGRPPSDVMLAVAEWNRLLVKIGLPEATVYDKVGAGSWIEANAPEFKEQFSNAFHYAMESDIFRIAYASKRPCIYIDIDSWPLAHAEEILLYGLSRPHSMLYFRAVQPFLNNSFFIAAEGCRFFAELARQCVAIDPKSLPQDYITVLETFGPVRYNFVLQEVSKQVRANAVTAARGVTGASELKFGDGSALLFANEFALAAQKPPFPLDYKSTDDHWKGFSLGYRGQE